MNYYSRENVIWTSENKKINFKIEKKKTYSRIYSVTITIGINKLKKTMNPMEMNKKLRKSIKTQKIKTKVKIKTNNKRRKRAFMKFFMN